MKNKRQVLYDEKMEQVKKEVYDELYNKPEIMEKIEYAHYIPKCIDDSEIRPKNYLENKRGSKPNKLYVALKNDDIEQAKEIVKNNEYISCSKICFAISTDVRTLKNAIATVGMLCKYPADDQQLPKCIADDFVECLLSLPLCKMRNILTNKSKRDSISILNLIDGDTLKNLKKAIEYIRLIIALECNSEEEYICKTNAMNNDYNIRIIETFYRIRK